MNKLILLIDDDKRNVFALELTLKARCYQVISAAGAAEGLELLRKHADIGTVLMDMMMPDMDGYQAIQEIKSLDGGERIPIIAVTAQAMPGDREKCIEAGAWDYVSKPIDIDRLVAIIEKHNNA